MAWVLLAVAIAAEVSGTIALKFSNGLTRPVPAVIVVIGYVLAVVLLAQVAKYVPIAVIYAIWSGLGTATVAAIGFTVLGEPVSPLKILGVALVICGVIALNLGGGH
jgi:small multidrug resistance pump